ncbi:MAG TPA: GNAT family N-acetyltransferase [Flavipsychrobacter sp.]|nr:GNAT family N-acetyltransferase [Flavipsychrobacter sp.]
MEIKLAEHNQTEEIFSILCNCKHELDKQGIFQWMDSYPTLSIVERDIEKKYLYCAVVENRCVGVISINDEQDPKYATITWNNNIGKMLIIHRLAVDPLYQGQGIARKLMDFAELYGINNNYSSVRLDAYSPNKRVLQFYEARGYKKRGEIFFDGRELPFFLYEKALQG